MEEENQNLEENMEVENTAQEVEENPTVVENTPENNELIKAKQDLDDLTDRYKRILAEFENFKKRSTKERELLYNNLLSDIIAVFLPVIDNLEKAAEAKTQDEDYKQGVELVLKQFNDVFTKLGIEEIAKVGETFDPELHDAVSSIQDETKGDKEIVQVYRKGYKIGTKIIRHAMVVVAN